MSRRAPADLARCAAALRVASGLAFIVAPRRLGGLLIGAHADAPGARLFIAAFGARDALLGAGTLKALCAEQPARWRIVTCAAADAFDTASTTYIFVRLPPRRRALTLVVSVLPAALGSWVAARLVDPAPSLSEGG